MKMSVFVMAIMVMCICPGSFSEEKDLVLGEQRRPKDCRVPKGKHGAVLTNGCIQSTCINGKWKPKMRTDICCYKQQVHKPNTVLGTIVSADNCSTTIECGAFAELKFKPNKCAVPATTQQVEQLENQVEDLSNQVSRKLEHQAEKIDNLTMMMRENIGLMAKLTSNGMWESVVPMSPTGLEGELPLLFSDNCCTRKSVGGVGYTQVAGSTDGYDCDGQCVYEKDGIPGSRTCFKSGGPAPLPAQCTASFIDSAYVSIVRNSEDIIFKTDIGTFSCNVGSATTEGEQIKCSELVDQEAGSDPGSEKAAFFFSKSPDGKFEWMCLHTDSQGIHCDFEKTLNCHYVPPSVGEADKLFVEGAQNVTGHDLKAQILDCQLKCNMTTSCWFWTLSFTATKPSEHEHGHRNHQGHSECGIRNYEARVLLKNINKDQLTGLRNNSRVFSGSVFVFDFFPSRKARDCKNSCIEQRSPNCTTWTWQPTKGENGGLCAINVYTPTRKIDISMRLPKPNLVSGCIQEDGSACITLPPKVNVVLIGGDGYSTGNVFAVNSDGILGPVCDDGDNGDDGWDNVGASVVCRQLGFREGNATRESYFGDVSINFAMDDVVCQGDEDTIQQCSHLITHDCSGREGAGVKCSP